MGFKCGIVGMPNVGKSTIFNALTSAGAASANYPFCTIDPNVGRVDVPDERMARIAKYIIPQKLVPTSMEFVDIAGLVRGAAKGEGLGNQFLGHIRQTDAIAHVVRCFDSSDIVHVEGKVDPLRDVEIIETELILADLETVDAGRNRYTKLVKTGKKEIPLIVAMLEALYSHLSAANPGRSFPLADFQGEEGAIENAYRELHLLTAKKVLYVCNVDESLASGLVDNDYTKRVREYALRDNAPVVIISGKIEEELGQLAEADKWEMIASMGLKELGLNRLIRSGYDILGLMTYFTAGEKEIRAWTVPKGVKAPAAAGKIHSDFERGFICAEVYTIKDLEALGSKAKMKEKGLVRQEGREYVVNDGDVMEFRFNV